MPDNKNYCQWINKITSMGRFSKTVCLGSVLAVAFSSGDRARKQNENRSSGSRERQQGAEAPQAKGRIRTHVTEVMVPGATGPQPCLPSSRNSTCGHSSRTYPGSPMGIRPRFCPVHQTITRPASRSFVISSRTASAISSSVVNGNGTPCRLHSSGVSEST